MKPVIITSGDPAGIGPEIALRAFDAGKKNIIIMGAIDHLQTIASQANLNIDLEYISEEDIQTQRFTQLIEKNTCPILPLQWSVSPISGKAEPKNAPQIIHSIRHAVELVKSGYGCAVVTNPIAKSVLYETGFDQPGHTEFLAELDGQERTVMMLANPQLRVVPLTVHIPLSAVPAALKADDFLFTLTTVKDSLKRDFGIGAPRIAVAGLNPHAGENGHIGTEEETLLKPLIDKARKTEIDILGPLPADTLFHPEAREQYDAVICMYHDQALIPVKTLDFFKSVNITLGLSFIRTSPDHGTAFDRAALFNARPDSLIAAIDMAEQMAQARHR